MAADATESSIPSPVSNLATALPSKPKPRKSGSFSTTFEAYQKATVTLHRLESTVRLGEHEEAEAQVHHVVQAKVIGHNIRNHVRHFTEHHCKVRSEHSAITWNGYEHSKTSAKKRRHAKTDGHFTPANRPYAPIGGSLEPAKKNHNEAANEVAVTVGREVVKSDKELLLSSPVVPLNDPEGLRVDIPSYSYKFIQIRLSDVSDVLNGRKVKLPMTLMIRMVEVVGNPDMYVVCDRQFNRLGIPSKEKNVWKTKTFLEIVPNDPNYTLGTYYIRVSCGVDATKFKLLATTHRHIPTIDQALMGPGHGYRPNEKEKREDIGRRLISHGIAQSDFRRRKGSSGNFPMSHVPMPSYFRPNSESPAAAGSISRQLSRQSDSASPLQPGRRNSASSSPQNPGQLDRQASRRHIAALARQATLVRHMSKRHLGAEGSRPTTALALSRSVDSQLSVEVPARPQSALERAVDATFRTTMDKLKYDYDNLEVQEVRVQDFFAILKPKKIEFAHVNQNKKQHELLFGGERSDLRAESTQDGSLPPPDREHSNMQARPGARNPIRATRRGGSFKEELLLLFRSTEPITRKLRDYELQLLAVPVAQVAGYAVIADEGPGNRKLVYRREGRPAEVKQGQAMTVTAGGQVPDGADAVVEAKNVTKLRLQDTSSLGADRSVPIVVSDLPVAGQNMRLEERPFYVGGGAYLTAREYCQVRYPHVLGDFDALFRQVFMTHKESGDGEQGGKAREETAVQEELAHSVLMGIDASPSKLLQSMKAKERKQLALGCKVYFVHSRSALVSQHLHEDADGVQARSMYLLLSGEMGVYLEAEEGARDFSDPAWDFFDDVDRRRRRFLGADGTQGALFGERQLLFGDAWPCTLVAMTTCKVAEVPLQALTDVIFARPDVLNGFKWQERERGFSTSQNHSKLLGIMSEVEKSAEGDQHRARAKTARNREGGEGDAARAKADDGEGSLEGELVTMMRLDTEVIKEEKALREYNQEMDELIQEGALNPEQLAWVLAERKEQELRDQAKIKPVERGARGDSISRILSGASDGPKE